ncbi:MAG TPA: ABC transporter permease [Acidimicrobiales bacterium]|nr:ABC transporter permease [Acidimicrobiales bacterium]
MTPLDDLSVAANSSTGTRTRSLGWVGLVIIATLVVLALLAPWIRRYRPETISWDFLQGPSWRHPLGTNRIGQDLASQMIEGARSSLLVAVLAGGGTVVIGASVGLIAGWRRGWVDLVVMRVVDVFLATPRWPLLILIGLYAGRDLLVVAAVIALLFWPGPARTLRSQVLSLRRRAHLKAAVGFGAGTVHMLRRHIVPEVGLILVAQFLSAMGRAIMLEAGLAFMGIGDPSRTSWGSIMRDAGDYSGLIYSNAYLWWMVPPMLAIIFTLLALTFVGMAVEQRINPRLARHHTGRA